MCISLLEDHILAHLLRTFRALPGWRLDVYKIDEPRKDSNQLPFVLVFTRTPGTQGLPTVLHFDGALISYSYAAPAEQRAKHVADTDAAIGQQVRTLSLACVSALLSLFALNLLHTHTSNHN